MFRIEFFARLILTIGGWAVFFASVVSAQATQYRAPRDSDGELRWQFKKGQVLRMLSDQTVSMSMELENRPMKTVNQSINEMTLTIDDVDGEGIAKAAATIVRMTMNLEANGQRFSFDSADEADQVFGPMKEISKMIRPMIGKKMTQDMSPTGKISNVNVPEEMLPANDNPMIAAMLNKKNLEEMSTRGSMEFPKPKLELGHTWQVKADLDMGMMKVAMKTDYTYLGVKEGPDGPLHVFEGKISMSFPQGAAGANVDIVHENSTGTFVFDGVRGLMRSSELHQDMALKIFAGGQTMQQQVLQTMQVSFSDITSEDAEN